MCGSKTTELDASARSEQSVEGSGLGSTLASPIQDGPALGLAPGLACQPYKCFFLTNL